MHINLTRSILFISSACALFTPKANAAIQMTPELPDSCNHLDEIIVTGVTGKTRINEIPASITTISPGTLASHPFQNIISALSRQPGISSISTGNGISKPVIRGLGYNRVLVVNDGVRQEGQQWGDEHGVEIDGSSVHSAEIIKGPASLMYGSDALAGVIVFNDSPMMSSDRIHAEASTGYASNNGLIDYSVNFRGNQEGIFYDVRWSQQFAHDYTNPTDGYVPNTRFSDRGLKGMIGLDRSWGISRIIASWYHFSPGITDTDTDLEKGGCSYRKMMPYQTIDHYKVVSDNSVYVGQGKIKAVIGYQQNIRKEIEEHDHDDHIHLHHHEGHGDESEENVGLYFRLHTINYDARYIPKTVNGWTGNIGINGMWQHSTNLGSEYLIPAYHLTDVGAFATVSKNFGSTIFLSGGVRYDLRHLHSHSLEEDDIIRFNDFSRNYSALSGSLGAVFNIGERLSLKANIARGYRAPNMSELASNGAHHGTFRYEIGDSDLKPEYSWQFDLGMDFSFDIVSGSLSVFANRISNYIYLKGTGELVSDVPEYRFCAGNARLMGGEATLSIHPLRWLHFHNSVGFVDARFIDTGKDGKYLPFIPAPRWIATLHCDIPFRSRWLNGTFAEIESDCNAGQNHVMTAGGTETSTPAYTLWNFSAGTDIYLSSGRKLCQLALSVENLLDRSYQSHLSRLKYAETLSITGRLGYCNMGRNIAIKIIFPFDF